MNLAAHYAALHFLIHTAIVIVVAVLTGLALRAKWPPRRWHASFMGHGDPAVQESVVRLPMNVPGDFYTTGYEHEGRWSGDCLSCDIPECEAPDLLAPLSDSNSDTYFVKQPITPEEITRAVNAVHSCCVDALRYEGTDPDIIRRLPANCCDYRVTRSGGAERITQNRGQTGIIYSMSEALISTKCQSAPIF